MAQFGDGDIIPRPLQWAGLRGKSQRAVLAFSGQIVKSAENVVKLMNKQGNSLDTWVVWPETSGWKYPYKDSQVSKEFWWKDISPKTCLEINDLIYGTGCSEKPYSTMNNNCQHFAKQLYDLC